MRLHQEAIGLKGPIASLGRDRIRISKQNVSEYDQIRKYHNHILFPEQDISGFAGIKSP